MDQYKVGVKLAFSTNAMGLFPALSKELLGLDAKIMKLAKSWTGVGLAIKGAMAGFAAEKMLTGLTDIVRKTADLSHELVQIQKLGVSVGDVATANSAAIGVTRNIRGISQTDALKIYGQLYSLVGKEDALKLLGPLAKYDVVQGNTTGDFGAAMSGSRDIVRAAEQMARLTNPQTGEVDLEKFQHFLDFAAKVSSATHGAVNSQTWLQIAKMGGPSLMNMDDRALGTVGILSQYMGGPKAGTAMMSTMQQFAGGTMFARSAQALQDIGELKEGEWSVKGGRVILNQEARQRLGKEFSNPLSAMENLIPKLKAHGYDTPDKMVNELFALFNRQTTQRAMADLLRNWGQVERELKRMDSGLGVDPAYDAANKGDVKQNLVNLTTQWQNFWYAVAGPNSENELSVLHSLTDFLGDFTRAIQGMNPAIVSAVGQALVALTAGLAVFATGAIASVLVGLGAVPAAIAGVVVALGALAVMNWDSIKDHLNMIGLFMGPQGILNFGITSLGEALSKYDWKSGFASVISGLQSLWDKLKGMFSGDAGVPNIASPMNYDGNGNGLLHRISYGPAGVGGSASTGGGAGRGFGGSSSTGGGGAGAGIAHYGSLAMGGGDVNAAIAVGAAAAGVDVPHFKAMASIESSLNPTSNWNRHTQYKGLFQIGRSEWAKFGHGNIYNAKDNALAMAALVNANRAIFRKRFGRDPTPDEIYLMHQQGPGFFLNGAMTNIAGNPYPGMHGPQNHNSFLNGWSAEVERRANRFGGSAIPSAKSRGDGEVQIHKHYLDGREIAARTISHITKAGNSSASGGRMYDRSYTRPISI